MHSAQAKHNAVRVSEFIMTVPGIDVNAVLNHPSVSMSTVLQMGMSVMVKGETQRAHG